MLLLHGIFDSSYAWVAAGSRRSLAFRAYERGFDVFLGNLRGSQWSRGHVAFGVGSADYWCVCVCVCVSADYWCVCVCVCVCVFSNVRVCYDCLRVLRRNVDATRARRSVL